MKIILLILSIIFIVLTFAGAAYILVNKGEANAGYACVPMVFSLVFIGAYRNGKRK